jgi:nucleotide-binding universal stress UspA family protein
MVAVAGSSERPEPKTIGAFAPHILALLPEVETVASCLQCALAAGGPDALVSGVHVGFDPAHAFVSAEETDIQQLRDIFEGKPGERAARVKTAFDSFVATRPPSPPLQWKDDEGDINVNVMLEAHDADLIVISRPLHLDACDALRSALFCAHRLVLVAPRDFGDHAGGVGRRIVIGWKPGDPVKRAIQAALPWLRRAEAVSVLWVEKHGAEPYDRSARAFFEKIGIDARIVGLRRNDQSVGRQLLSEARRHGDCLLVGAYKHGALWEAIFGGVTRDILGHADLPVFLMR